MRLPSTLPACSSGNEPIPRIFTQCLSLCHLNFEWNCSFPCLDKKLRGMIKYLSKLMKCQVVKMSGWQNVRLTKCQVGKMSGWQNVRLTKCQVDKMSGWQNVRLTKCQVDKMSGWQNVRLMKCQVDKWLVDKLASWQMGSLQTGMLTKSPVDKVTISQNDKLTKLLFDKMICLQNYKSTRCQVDKWVVDKLANWQKVKLAIKKNYSSIFVSGEWWELASLQSRHAQDHQHSSPGLNLSFVKTSWARQVGLNKSG